jgi:hypothetical protein
LHYWSLSFAILEKPSGDLTIYQFKHWEDYCSKNWSIIPLSKEVITCVEQLANGLQETTTPDNDDEPARIDIDIGNDGEACSVAEYRSETEGYDPDTKDEVVDNNDNLSSASSLEFIGNVCKLNKDEEELMLK